MKTKYVIISIITVFTLGYFSGKHNAPAKTIEVVKIKEVFKESADKIVIKEVTKEGKIRTITKYKVNTIIKTDKQSKKTITLAKNDYGVNLGGSLIDKKYQISVDRRLFNRLSVGIYSNIDILDTRRSDYGLYLRVEF